MKRALVFNPYWDTKGGGERYGIGVAGCLVQSGYTVDIPWPEVKLISDLEARYGINPNKLQVRPELAGIVGQNFWQKYRLMQRYEVIFWVSDGSIPWLWGKRNLLHFQVPFKQVGGKSWLNRLKFKNQTVVCNSNFTKTVIDREFGIDSLVVYPPVKLIPPLKKKKYILSVGRFDNLMHPKRQDELIAAYAKLKIKGWSLVLAGGLVNNQDWLNRLKQQAAGKRVIFAVNPNYLSLAKWYGEASLYWHAAGFGADLQAQPEKAEHFGIATVEAMSAGAVPLVFGGGGQTEIIRDGVNGRLWQTRDELVSQTEQLIRDETKRHKLALKAKDRASNFSEEVFTHAVQKLVG